MSLVPTDYPARCSARGVPGKVMAGWEQRGGSADHECVNLHHTASSTRTSPASDASYCATNASNAPLYNVLVDRTGMAWYLARERAASSGQISGVALREALDGRANLTPAAQRKLKDTTSANAAIFGIAGQNDGRTEPWSPALVRSMTICAAVALECLGKTRAGYVSTHRAMTARKPDPSGPGCPYDWHALIAPEIGGGGGWSGEDDEMPSGAQQMVWTKSGNGYWIVGSDGGVFAYGDAGFFDSMGGKPMNAPVVGIAITPTERGYTLLGQDGGTFHFGDAKMLGAPTGEIR